MKLTGRDPGEYSGAARDRDLRTLAAIVSEDRAGLPDGGAAVVPAG